MYRPEQSSMPLNWCDMSQEQKKQVLSEIVQFEASEIIIDIEQPMRSVWQQSALSEETKQTMQECYNAVPCDCRHSFQAQRLYKLSTFIQQCANIDDDLIEKLSIKYPDLLSEDKVFKAILRITAKIQI